MESPKKINYLRKLSCVLLLIIVVFIIPLNVTHSSQLTNLTSDGILNYPAKTLNFYQSPYRHFRDFEFETNGTVKFLWPDDPDCKKHEIQFAKHLQRSYLVSFPRSGNTWTRYLIEAASGIFTSSLYRDPLAKKLGFLGETEPLNKFRTILFKTHTISFETADLKSRKKLIPDEAPVILIMRNPLQCIRSWWEFKLSRDRHINDTMLHTLNESYFKSSAFHRFFYNKILRWREVYEDRLILAKNLLIVFYEHLVENPIREVSKMLRFLGVRENEERMACLLKHIDGPAKKRTNKMDPYKVTEKEEASYNMASIISLLRQHKTYFPDEYLQLARSHTALFN